MLGEEPVANWKATAADITGTMLLDPLTYLGGIGVAKAGAKAGVGGYCHREA